MVDLSKKFQKCVSLIPLGKKIIFLIFFKYLYIIEKSVEELRKKKKKELFIKILKGLEEERKRILARKIEIEKRKEIMESEKVL